MTARQSRRPSVTRFLMPITSLVCCLSALTSAAERDQADEEEIALIKQVQDAALQWPEDFKENEDPGDYINRFNLLLAKSLDTEPVAVPRELAENRTYQINFKRMVDRLIAGEATIKIVGGGETDGYPECVAISNGKDWGASGVVIDRRLILTAAHNLDNGYSRQVCISPEANDPDATVINVIASEKFQDPPHRALGKPVYLHDLAVLYLEEPLPDSVPTAKRAAANLINNAAEVLVVGYGSNAPNGEAGKGVRRVVAVAIASSNCPEKDEEMGCHEGYELVAGEPSLGKYSCIADSGGPAFVIGPRGMELAGITSRPRLGNKVACGDGGIYVRIDHAMYDAWIKRMINQYRRRAAEEADDDG